LRAVSSRGEVTPTSFSNEYNFGNFKGDPGEWMEKYFDGFLYLAKRENNEQRFQQRLRTFRAQHLSKSALKRQIVVAGP
jgi:hypothetical protein